MGAVPVAALDPVFYLHHANIDRLYDCWLQVDEAGRLPTDQACSIGGIPSSTATAA